MKRGIVLSALAALLLSGAAQAGECGKIKSNEQRLACYDALEAKASAAASGGEMDIADFKTDKGKLRGRQVSLRGFLTTFGDDALLMQQIGDLNPVFIDVSRVPREQRRQLMSCGNVCRGTVAGTVGGVSVGQVGVIATSIAFE